MLAALVIAILAVILANYLSVFGSILMALILGMVAGNVFLRSDKLHSGLKFSEKTILEMSIVLIGFGFEAGNLENLSWSLLIILAASIAVVILLALGIGKLLGLNSRLSMLLGAGSAICGSAAIAATAPVIDANEEEVGVSIGAVNLIGTIGLAFLPALALFLHFTDFQSAVLLGGTLQSIGHVAASSFAMNNEVGEWAMVVKMSRVMFMIPLLLVLFFIGRKRVDTKVSFPYFIFFFAFAVYLAQLDSMSSELTGYLAMAGNFLMAVAMTAIGVGIKIKPLLRISPKGLALGSILFLIQILMFAGYAVIFA